MEQADIVEKLLQELKVKRVHVLAHDYGDTVGQEMLARLVTVLSVMSVQWNLS